MSTDSQDGDRRVYGGLDSLWKSHCRIKEGWDTIAWLLIFCERGNTTTLPAAESGKSGAVHGRDPQKERGDKRVGTRWANHSAALSFLAIFETISRSYWLIPARAARCQGISKRFEPRRSPLIGLTSGSQGKPSWDPLGVVTLWTLVVVCRAIVADRGLKLLDHRPAAAAC